MTRENRPSPKETSVPTIHFQVAGFYYLIPLLIVSVLHIATFREHPNKKEPQMVPLCLKQWVRLLAKVADSVSEAI